MQKNISIIIFLITIPLFVSAQLQSGYEIKQTMDLFNSNRYISGDWRKQLTESDIEGTPFLNDEFISGTIYTTQKQQYKDIPLRLNIYNDQLEFKNPSGEILAMSTPEIVELAIFDEYKLTYSAFLEGSRTKTGFFVIVEQGKATLLTRKSIMYMAPTEPGGYKEAQPARLVNRSDEYYIKVDDYQALPADSKKNLIAAFPDNHDKIEAFISKNKTKTNKAESVAEVVRYYNSL